ncbi:MAG: YtxH domain-containing protein [Candidatus Hydromicrobium sp.]
MNVEKEKNNGKSSFLGIMTSLLVGLSAGFVIGILFAPKSGKETRKEIKEKSEELIEKSKAGFDIAVGRTKEYVDSGKSKLAEIKSRSEEFIEKGKEKISGFSKVLSSKAGKARKKIKKVIEKGKDTAKKVEEDLS